MIAPTLLPRLDKVPTCILSTLGTGRDTAERARTHPGALADHVHDERPLSTRRVASRLACTILRALRLTAGDWNPSVTGPAVVRISAMEMGAQGALEST